jgi:hypothetical protein
MVSTIQLRLPEYFSRNTKKRLPSISGLAIDGFLTLIKIYLRTRPKAYDEYAGRPLPSVIKQETRSRARICRR